MGIVATILSRKGNQVFMVDRELTVFEAIHEMVGNNVGALLVTGGDQIVGIFTERDYLKRIVLEGRTSKTTKVREVMTAKVVCVEPSCSLEDCMATMTQQRIRHLPVMEDGKLVGLVSIGDIVKLLSQERKTEIRYLTDYIQNQYPG